MNSKFIVRAVAAVGMLMAVGCAKQMGGLAPGVDAARLRTFHVLTEGDKKGTVTDAVVNELKSRGFSVSEGSREDAPATLDCIVEVTSKWAWDITVYLMDLKVKLLEPGTGKVLGSGGSYRNSVMRKDQAYMVKEVF